MALNLIHQTNAQLIERLRERYRMAKNEDATKIAKFIVDRINSGDIVEDDIRSAFVMNHGKWTVFKLKLGEQKATRDALLSAQGE